jgi:putative Mn2+ efflux pump MntP
MDILLWFLLALPLALDVFAAGLVFGLAGMERSRWLTVAAAFAIIGGALIGIGVLLGDAMEGAAGTATKYVAAVVLLAIGLRSITHGLKSGDPQALPPLNSRKIATTAFAVAIDKLAVGLSFAVLEAPMSLMVIIVAGQAFAATLLGLWLGKRLGTRAGDMAEIIAGAVFSVLGLVVFYQAVSGRS